MATDDEGHSSEAGLGGGGLFGLSQDLRVQYGYLSEHALDVVAKDIITAFYGRGPNYSYYDGCSDGGREAMEVAERYPTDFNGIIAGAPEIIAGPLNAEQQTWDYKVNVGPDGNTILTADKLPALHAAVIAACGGDDGVNDGIITDPRSCHFNPASIECPAGTNTVNCLTPDRSRWSTSTTPARLIRRDASSTRAECRTARSSTWNVFQIPPQTANGVPVPGTDSLDYSGLSLPYLRYQLLPAGQLGPDPSQWKFTDQDFQSMFPSANTFDAMSVNLKAFRAHGGKLIIWQGWADNGIPPTGTVDYYEDLEKFMGGSNVDPGIRAAVPVPGRVPLRPGLHQQLLRPRLPDGPVGRGQHARRRQVIASDTVERHGTDAAGLSVSGHPEVQRQRRPEFGEQLPPVSRRRPTSTPTGTATTCSRPSRSRARRPGATRQTRKA